MTVDIVSGLANYRPDRYNPYEKGWMDALISEVSKSLTAEEARQRAARTMVYSTERNAPQETNKVLRTFAETGIPLTAEILSSHIGDLPLVIEPRKWRVKLRACTPQDLRSYATHETEAAKVDHEARLLSVKGAEDLADLIEDAGVSTFGEWLDQ